MKIYIVMGGTGEYSDRSEWIVCAYEDLAMAQTHVEKVTKEADRVQSECERYSAKADDKAKVWDDNMRIDYTGAYYWVDESYVRFDLPGELND